MRTFPILLPLFCALAGSLCPLQAQPPLSSGRELPRSELRVYPSEELAAAAAEGNSYLRPVGDWTREGASFGASFTVPFSWINRQVLFHLDDAPAAYELFVNGQPAGSNSDPALPAEFNITSRVREGANRLEIRLRPAAETAPLESWQAASATPAVGRAWVMTQPTQRIRDVLVGTRLSDNRTATAEVGMIVKSSALNPRTSRIHYELLDPAGRRITGGTEELTLDMRREDTLRFVATVPDTLLWQPGAPCFCTLRLKTQHEGRYAEYIELPLGLRVLQVDADGQLQLNGRAVPLRAAAVSPRIDTAAIATLRTQGYNTLRLQAGPVRPGLYDDCDRLGMLVVAQAPLDTRDSGPSRKRGGNPSNDPAWQAHFVERVLDSYHTAQRHPSVVAFSLADHSANGICLYESYLAVKRFIDEPRPFIYLDGGNEWNSDRLKLE